jgi:membrane-associated phospholipid phosphatase
VVVYLAAFELGAAARADTRLFFDFTRQDAWANDYAAFVVRFFNPRPFAVAVLIVLVAAAWLRGVRGALAVAAIFAGANLTTQLLKSLTAAPRNPPWLDHASWPSGHVTAAASLALCVVLIAPAALRPYAVVAGALGVLAAATSIMVIGSHLPSDVVGALLVAGAWTGLVVAVERRAPRVGSQGGGRPLRRGLRGLRRAASALPGRARGAEGARSR